MSNVSITLCRIGPSIILKWDFAKEYSIAYG